MNYGALSNKNISDVVIRGTVIVIFFILILGLGYYFKINPDDLKQIFIGESLSRSVATYIFLYVVVTFFIWLSKDIFRFIGAVIFGPYLSTLLIFLAELINAAILFSLSRYLGKDFVDRILPGRSRGLHHKISRRSLWFLFCLRAVPLVPFRMLDLVCGLTQMRLSQYLLIVALASPARIFWLQYILAGLGEAAFKDPSRLMQYLLGNQLVFIWSFCYLVLIIILIYRLRRKI